MPEDLPPQPDPPIIRNSREVHQPPTSYSEELPRASAERDDMLHAIDKMAAYIKQLEDALLSAPLFDPREAYTMQERHHVARQDNWRERHKEVLQRAYGGAVDRDREREIARQEAVGKVRLVMSRVRIMNQRVAYGDPEAMPIDTPTALELIERELQRL